MRIFFSSRVLIAQHQSAERGRSFWEESEPEGREVYVSFHITLPAAPPPRARSPALALSCTPETDGGTTRTQPQVKVSTVVRLLEEVKKLCYN